MRQQTSQEDMKNQKNWQKWNRNRGRPKTTLTRYKKEWRKFVEA